MNPDEEQYLAQLIAEKTRQFRISIAPLEARLLEIRSQRSYPPCPVSGINPLCQVAEE